MSDQKLAATACAFGLNFGLMTVPLLAAGISGWDTNTDKKLDKAEFNTGVDRVGVFKKWDANADGKLSPSELKTGVSKHGQAFDTRFGNDAFNKLGTENDSYLSSSEFNDRIYPF
ncbi:hypothetical protein [Bradyrhizobium sp. P5_C11_2]